MPDQEHTVYARWDDEAGVWVVIGSTVPGLVTEAPTMEVLIQKLERMVPELLEENGVLPPGEERGVPWHLLSDYRAVTHGN